jgi:hemolysin III
MEELFNALSHGLGLVLAIASLPILVYSASQKGQAAGVVGACLFAGTAIVLYLISTLYHALPMGRAKAWFNRLDHAAIYLFIAGSYMPFLFGVLRGPLGWTLFGAICAAAVLGVSAKLFNRLQHPLWSTGLYVAMGWMALMAAVPLYERMSAAGLGWLVAGGLSTRPVLWCSCSTTRYVMPIRCGTCSCWLAALATSLRCSGIRTVDSSVSGILCGIRARLTPGANVPRFAPPLFRCGEHPMPIAHGHAVLRPINDCSEHAHATQRNKGGAKRGTFAE